MSYEFAPYRLLPSERQLLCDGAPVKLGARAFDLLAALVERRDRTISKNELMDLVWSNVVVEENNLEVQIVTLRKLLGYAAIATVPGRGYRFTLPVEQTGTRGVQPSDRHPSQAWKHSNLPAGLSTLFGRDDDLAALGALLSQHRLITVTGPGGIGKSRLAQQLVHLRRDLFDGGVAWAELGALTDGALIGGAIAAALDVETLGADLSRELAQVLKERKALIVLDNAEHLVEDVARLVHALVEGTSHLVLVVTSQAPLKLRFERVYRLGPLDVPETVVAVDDARSYGAVALFEERAQAVDRRFALSEHNVGTVIDICRHLDGLPLAIELAAARVPLLGVSQLSSALEERLRVLSSRDSTVPRRQQTLRAALEWSYGLLGPQEQIVFRRLALFAGSFSLSLAKQVVTDDGREPLVDEWAFLDALGALIDRSLVVADSAEVPRYRLLESARAFALELLVGANEEAPLRLRHARVIRSHFERLDADRWDGRTSIDDVLTELEPDLDNAREAMGWTLRHEPPLAVALWAEFCFALTRSRFLDQAREWEITGRLLTDDVPLPSRAKWHRRLAQFWGNRNPQAATTSIRRALELHRKCGAEREVFLDLQIFCWLNRGNLLDERDSALEEMRRLENPNWSSAMKFRLSNAEALLCIDKGAFDTAIAALRRSLELAESAGDSQATRSTLLKLAECELSMERIDEALRRCLDLEQRLTGTRHRWDLSLAQALIVSAWLAKNDTERARQAALAGWSLACQIGMSDEWTDKLALLAALEGRSRQAARLLGYADATFAASGATRRASDARAKARAITLASAWLDGDEFARLKDEGASLSESDIEAIAFGPDDGD